VHQDLSVGAGAKPVTQGLKFTADLNVVVQLAIEDNPNAPIFITHGLPAALDVHDAQAAMPERDTGAGGQVSSCNSPGPGGAIRPVSFPVGPAVLQFVSQAGDQLRDA